MPARTRKGATEKKEHPCAEGCKVFSKAGTNAYVSVVTCLECGHGSKEKKAEMPTFAPESCPHDEIDRRGSNRQFIMMYCKQCCTHVDMRDRNKTEQFDPVRAKLQLASPDQQRLAPQRSLTKRLLAWNQQEHASRSSKAI